MNNNQKHIVKIIIPCSNLNELKRAKESVLYHLETLGPKFKVTNRKLTVTVIPLDPKLFQPEEACNIIRQTLAQSLTFIHDWTCTLHTIN